MTENELSEIYSMTTEIAKMLDGLTHAQIKRILENLQTKLYFATEDTKITLKVP